MNLSSRINSTLKLLPSQQHHRMFMEEKTQIYRRHLVTQQKWRNYPRRNRPQITDNNLSRARNLNKVKKTIIMALCFH